MNLSFVFIYQLVFYLLLGLTLILTLINRDALKKLFRRISQKTYIILILIIVLAVFLRIYAHPNCERWYTAEIFIDRASGGMGESYIDFQFYMGLGFYYILNAFFYFFPPTYASLFLLNFIAGIALVTAGFLLSYLLFGNEKISIVTSFLFAVSPVFIIISVSESYTLMAVLFSLIALTYMFMFIRTGNFHFYLASLFMMICAIIIRPEYILFAFVFFVTCIIFKEHFRDRKILYATAIFLIANSYLFWVIYGYSVRMFSYDRALTGATLDSERLFLSVILNSGRLFAQNLEKSFIFFFSVDFLTIVLPVFVLIGSYYLIKIGRKRELAFLVFYFILFSLSYISLHVEGLHDSGFKYIPSSLTPLFFISSPGILFLSKKINPKIFMISLVVLFTPLSLYEIHFYNLELNESPEYQEYSYLLENIKNVNTDCYVIDTKGLTIFKSTFNFGDDRYIEIGDEKALADFISANRTGCFYLSASYHYEEYILDEGNEIYKKTLFSRLSQAFELRKIVDKSLSKGRMMLYYFENGNTYIA